MRIGFIGQGYVGKNTADSFVGRGYEVVRYSLEPEYLHNKQDIATCDVVFVAVPTPTTPQGFNVSIVDEALSLIREGKIAVIKSTMIPGTTRALQEKHPRIKVCFSPEFLSKATAAEDTKHPIFNIVGYVTEAHRGEAEKILTLLPPAKEQFVVTSETAELFKYVHNVHGFVRVVLSNLFYNLAEEHNIPWNDIHAMMQHDPMMSPYYNDPVHQSGRGAGGCCFIKDFAAFRMLYEKLLPEDTLGRNVLMALEQKNLELLTSTHKNQNYIDEVYGVTKS
jgi:nucleotide sugar dehydrogenase